MKPMWAPWRMEYILSEGGKEECIFCPGPDRGRDESRLILHVGSLSMVMMNRFPYINGHILVAPLRHISSLEKLTPEETLDLLSTVSRCTAILRKTMGPDGFNVGLNLGKVAGAGVDDHIHFHIVPRWGGDTNFMTVFGEVRVIPEHIEETYRRLRPFFPGSGDDNGGDK